MTYIPHDYRQHDMNRSMWGMRIFQQGINVPSTSPEDNASTIDWIRKEGGERLTWIASYVGRVGADMAQTVKDWAINIPSGVMDGIRYAWENGPRPQVTLSELLTQVASFFRWDPNLGAIIERQPNKYDLITLQKLTNPAEWISALRSLENSDFLTNTFIQDMPEDHVSFGPKELLLSLPVEERQDVYVRFVKEYIPESVRRKNGWHSEDPKKLITKIDGDKETINDTLSMILGMADKKYLNPADKNLAKARGAAVDSLSLHYGKNNEQYPYEIPSALEEDYVGALQYDPLRKNSALATNAQRLSGPLQYSRFKGALKLGVIDNEMLKFMYPVLQERDFEISRASGRARDRTNALTGAKTARERLNTKTIMDNWRSLHPGMQLLIGGALLYGFFKTKLVRWPVIGLAGAILYRKLVMGEDDPVEGVARLIKGPIDAFKQKNANDFGAGVTPGVMEESAAQAKLYTKFASKFDYANMEDHAVNLSMLDVSMGVLEENFKMGEPAGESFYLDIEGMDIPLRDAAKARKWKKGYREHFANMEARRQAAEAVGFIFYLRAVKDSGNWEAFKFIERVRGQLPPGSSLARLPSPYHNPDRMKNQRYGSADPSTYNDMVRAQELYVRLIDQGKNLSIGDRRPMGDFILSTMGMVPALKESKNIGGIPDKRVVDNNAGGEADKKTAGEGDEADKKTAGEGGEADKKTAGEGDEADKKTAGEGDEADKKTAGEGDEADKKTAGEGDEADKKTAGEGDEADKKAGGPGGEPKKAGK